MERRHTGQPDQSEVLDIAERVTELLSPESVVPEDLDADTYDAESTSIEEHLRGKHSSGGPPGQSP